MKIVKYHISIAVLFSHNHIFMVTEYTLLYVRELFKFQNYSVNYRLEIFWQLISANDSMASIS